MIFGKMRLIINLQVKQQIIISNKMENGNTKFYHGHIQTNIQKLDERKDKFIHFRLNFLKQYCRPLQQKIEFLRKQIIRYEIMRDTQQQVIENEPQILKVKGQISNYLSTNKYFQTRVNEYQKKAIDYKFYNQELKYKINLIKNNIMSLAKKEIGITLPQIDNKINWNKSIHKQEDKSNPQRQYYLPCVKINKTQDCKTSSSRVTNKHRIIKISQKIQITKQILSRTEISVKDDLTIKENIILQNKKQFDMLKKKQLEVRQIMTKFDRTETLFRQCFDKKKGSVQKSVSQLQSKLIENRQIFLNTCQAIGAKQSKIDFQSFQKLSGDEIMTLFISFAWLNKKIYSQFAKKRKVFMEAVGKLPKSQILQ